MALKVTLKRKGASPGVYSEMNPKTVKGQISDLSGLGTDVMSASQAPGSATFMYVPTTDDMQFVDEANIRSLFQIAQDEHQHNDFFGSVDVVGESDDLQTILDRKVDLINGKIDHTQFPVANHESLTFIGTTGLLSVDSNTPTPLDTIFGSALGGIDTEAKAQELVGSFEIVTDTGFIEGVTIGNLTYKFLLTGNEAIDDPQTETSDGVKVESGDWVVFVSYVETAAGVFDLNFAVINSSSATATVTTTGIVQLSTNTDIQTYSSSSNATKLITSGLLKTAMTDNRVIVNVTGLPGTGELVSVVAAQGSLPPLATSGEFGLVGTGATRDIYTYNGSTWTDTGDATTQDTGSVAMFADAIIHDVTNNTDYFFVGGALGEVTPASASNLPMEDDLVFEIV